MMTKFKSYPFLEIARTEGVGYGDVLSYADLVAGKPMNIWQMRASKSLPIEVRNRIDEQVRSMQ